MDQTSKKAVYEQIVDRYIEYIIKGVYVPGDKMPSVRELSSSLHVNPNTIQKVYRELEERGYIYSLAGKGSYVSDRHVLDEKSLTLLKAHLDQVYDLMKHGQVSLDWIIDYLKQKGGLKHD